MSLRKDYFSGNTLVADLFHLVAGDLIGEGSSRTVHLYRPDPRLVIKFETGAQNFQNVLEWRFWEYYSAKKEIAVWLAPIRSISACGTILLQERATDVTAEELPVKIPGMFCDLKADNWGRLNGKIVCRDYGFNVQNVSTRLKKAEWAKP